MIKNIVYRLKKDVEVTNGVHLSAGQEIEIVMGVIYINGNMLVTGMQDFFYHWIQNNLDLFDDVTKNW